MAALAYGPQAEFLGVDPMSLIDLSPEEVDRKVNDKMSLYNQKQMGYGVSDSYGANFKNQMAQLNQSLQQVDRAVTNVVDRRRGISPEAQQKAPDLNRIVRNSVNSMEDRIVAKVFRQLQKGIAT